MSKLYELERRKVYRELKKFSRDFILGSINYYITYDFIYNDFDFISSHYTKYYGLCFESYKQAEKAIKTVGKERVKKYYLQAKGKIYLKYYKLDKEVLK